MLGQVNLDDYELKIRRLLRYSKHRQTILKLPRGVFLYPSTDQIISFPKHEQDSQPFEVTYTKPTPQEEKSKTIWQTLKDMFQSKKPDIPSVYDEEEDFDTELEEDLIIEEEW